MDSDPYKSMHQIISKKNINTSLQLMNFLMDLEVSNRETLLHSKSTANGYQNINKAKLTEL